MPNLNDRVALITGAASGIGRASAIRMATEGAKVMCADLDAAGAEATANVINQEGGDALGCELNVTSSEAVKATVQRTAETFGKLNVIFNNAGIAGGNWDQTIAVNLSGVYYGLLHGGQHMANNGGGSIINMSSLASSQKGVPVRFIYGASKAAVLGMTKSVAADYVTEGIRCNAICPGTVESPSLEDRLHAQGDYERTRAEFVARQPMGRIGRPDEIAALVVYLASEDDAYTTGQALNIDGGWSI